MEDNQSSEHENGGESPVQLARQTSVPQEVIDALSAKSIDKEIRDFVKSIDSLADTLPLTMVLLQVESRRLRHQLKNEFKVTEYKSNDGNEYLEIEAPTSELSAKLRVVAKKWQKANMANQIVAKSFLVSLVSQFDAFIVSVVRYFYNRRPELLDSSGRQLTFAELAKFDSISAARNHVIEKEIDSVFRGSHSDHFEWLGKFSGISGLHKYFKAWPQFIEITERRNLFVHTGGTTSQQYLDICKLHKSPTKIIKIGAQLGVSRDYFDRAYETVIELGVLVAQSIWRKLLPDEMSHADSNLIEVCYDLIAEEKYEVASSILDHAIEQMKHLISDEPQLLMIEINRAQSYKWSGKPDKCKQILSSYSWNAKDNEYKICAATLMEDYDNVERLMKIIGTTGIPKQQHYRDWPIFKEIRKMDRFAKIFEEIFSAPLILPETELSSKPSILDWKPLLASRRETHS